MKLQIIQNPSTCSELPLLLAMDSETPEEELLDLLTCHRSVSGLNWSHNGYNNETPVLPFDAHFTDFFLKNTFDCFSPAPSTEDAEGPFPWDSTCQRAATKRHHTGDAKVVRSRGVATPMNQRTFCLPKPTLDKVSTWGASIPANLMSMPGLKEMLQEADAIGCIDFKLPPQKSISGPTSGVVLRYAIGTLEGLFRKHDPMIFKIGFTHNCVFRWSNPVFGYAAGADKFSNMCVLHMCEEPFTPSMLEAALIEKFASILTCMKHIYDPLYIL